MKYLLHLTFLTAALLIFSCKNKTAPPENTGEPAPDERLDFTAIPGERVGLVTAKNCTPEGILAAYGDLAKKDSVYLGEGIWNMGVVLFPDDEKNKVEIFWDKIMSEKYPAFFRIRGKNGMTDWKTTEGITVGMDIAEVEKLNGSAFTLFGFGWDYGGYVTDYGNGRFTNAMGLRFEPGVDEYSEKIMGEDLVISNASEVLAAAPRVVSMEPRILAREELPACILEKAGAHEGDYLVIQKMTIDGTDHFWMNSGAAAYDGTESILNENCEEVCSVGGHRPPLECAKVYQNGRWERVWEK